MLVLVAKGCDCRLRCVMCALMFQLNIFTSSVSSLEHLGTKTVVDVLSQKVYESLPIESLRSRFFTSLRHTPTLIGISFELLPPIASCRLFEIASKSFKSVFV